MGRKKLKFIFLLIVLLFNVFTSLAQNKYAFSTGAYGGFTFRSNRSVYELKTTAGFNYGIDLEARRNNFSLFFESAYNPENQNNDGILEISVGPRWLIGDKDFFTSLEAGLAVYKFHNNTAWGTSSVGLNAGAGANYALSKKVDIFLKGKYHFIGINYLTSYSEIVLGLRLYFKK